MSANLYYLKHEDTESFVVAIGIEDAIGAWRGINADESVDLFREPTVVRRVNAGDGKVFVVSESALAALNTRGEQ